MDKHDIGVLSCGDRVFINGSPATVVSPHEPEWIDHRTRAFRKEFKGADVRLDSGQYFYAHAKDIRQSTATDTEGRKDGEHG